MPRISLYKPIKGNDYKFADRAQKEQFYVGGTALMVYKYIGTGDGDENTIQDSLFLENRDRKYDKDVYELRGMYTVQDNDFDLSEWGLGLPTDIVFMNIHINDCVDILGRKIIPGDVIELPHMRDDLLVNEEDPALNRYYKIEDVTRAADGFSPTWYPHVFRVKMRPLEDTQEFRDIIGDEGGEDSLADILSSYNAEIEINDKWYEQAVAAVPHRNMATQQFWVIPDIENIHSILGTQYAWIFAGDGEPQNGAKPVLIQGFFPTESNEGDWFLHTGYSPNILFTKHNKRWLRVEYNFQQDWSAASRTMETFINNTNKTTFNNNEIQNEKQGLSRVVTRRDKNYGGGDWNLS